MDPLSTIILHQVMIPGLAGDGMTVAEASALRADLADYEAQLAAFGLGDLTDVNAATPSDGQVLTYNSTSGDWEPETPQAGIPVVAEGGTWIEEDVNKLSFYADSFNVSVPGPNEALVQLSFGGSGTASTVAHSDHTHTTAYRAISSFPPGGYMSSGTRNLKTIPALIPSGVTALVTARLRIQIRGADPGACYYRLSVTIDGDTRTSNSGSNGKWCVQGVPDEVSWHNHQTIIGTGAAFDISAAVQYDGGGGFYTDAGELEIEVLYNE